MSEYANPLYPVEVWSVGQQSLDSEQVGADETVFALGNGLFGIRGTYCENGLGFTDGTFVNGFYETEPIVYGERAYGYADNHQRMIPLPDATIIELSVDGEPFDLTTGEILSHSRELQLREGQVVRSTEWLSPEGVRVSLETTRLVSFRRPHVFAVEWSVRTDRSVHLEIVSVIRGRGLTRPDTADPRVGGGSERSPLLLG
jgi:alpha,alpha-trehalose phosphorylase